MRYYQGVFIFSRNEAHHYAALGLSEHHWEDVND